MGFNILDVVNAATRAEVGENKDYKAFAAEYVQKFGGPAAGERS